MSDETLIEVHMVEPPPLLKTRAWVLRASEGWTLAWHAAGVRAVKDGLELVFPLHQVRLVLTQTRPAQQEREHRQSPRTTRRA